MWIRKSEFERLSADIRRLIDGRSVDIRDNREGVLSALKNDVHTLAEKQNEQLAALQSERDKLKDTLADISHQLKTPLTSMILMADLLETAPPDKQAEFVGNIRAGLAHMEWLVSALLKMAKLDAGAIEFKLENAGVLDLVKTALEPMQILIELKNQTVAVDGGVDILCDKRWTAEALTNIVKNASEYSPQGGAIAITAGENPICSWISVTDSGAGIDSIDIPKLFKRFESGGKGYGIGLPLALAIMRGQGGDVEVERNTFTLKFYK